MKLKRQCPLPSVIKETSGLVFDDKFIISHNDSGDSACIYFISNNGILFKNNKITNAENHDWEDMTANDKYFFIADIGNNLKSRDTLSIYAIAKNSSTNSIAYKIDFNYPDNKRFDSEAIVSYNDSLYIFTKNRKDYYTYIFSVASKAGFYTVQKTDSIRIPGQITGADYSKKDSLLLLIGYRSFVPFVLLISTDNPSKISEKKIYRKTFFMKASRQTEAIAIKDKKNIIISSEAFLFRRAMLFNLFIY